MDRPPGHALRRRPEFKAPRMPWLHSDQRPLRKQIPHRVIIARQQKPFQPPFLPMELQPLRASLCQSQFADIEFRSWEGLTCKRSSAAHLIQRVLKPVATALPPPWRGRSSFPGELGADYLAMSPASSISGDALPGAAHQSRCSFSRRKSGAGGVISQLIWPLPNEGRRNGNGSSNPTQGSILATWRLLSCYILLVYAIGADACIKPQPTVPGTVYFPDRQPTRPHCSREWSPPASAPIQHRIRASKTTAAPGQLMRKTSSTCRRQQQVGLLPPHRLTTSR